MKNFAFLLFIFTVISFSSCKDDKDDPETQLPITVTDIDGNVYNTLTIGTQVWMIENLRVTKYNDGTAIPNVTDTAGWSTLTTSAYCNLNNDAANVPKYGRLYNWYAVNTGKLAPAGWHVPTKDEWTTLKNYVLAHLGTSGSAAQALAAPIEWEYSSNTGAPGNNLSKNNSSGFSALPSSYRIADGTFENGVSGCRWWSSTQSDDYKAWTLDITNYASNTGSIGYSKEGGLSIRCIKD